MPSRKHGFRRRGTRKRFISRSRGRSVVKISGFRRRHSASRMRPRRSSLQTKQRKSFRRPSFRSRRRLRGGVGLTRSVNGPVNSSYRFRSSYRRKFNISRKMKTRVALAQGHTLQATEVINGSWTGTNGECVWAQDFLGSRLQTTDIESAVEANYVGLAQSDWNTTAGTAKRYKINIKVLNDSSSFLVMNASNMKVTVSCYPLLPRCDVTAGNTALSLLSAGREGDLQSATGGTMPYTDPRFTPYMSPELCAQYKILKPRTFTVHGGGKFNLQLRHSYNMNNLSTNVFGSSAVIGKKGIYRPMLIKLVGEIGVVTTVAGTSLRHLPVNCVWKNNVFWQAHASAETRLIYNDIAFSKNAPLAAPSAEVLFEEENLNAVTFNKTAISLTT